MAIDHLIENPEDNFKYYISDLKTGDFFEYKGEVYFLTDYVDQTDMPLAVFMCNGTLKPFKRGEYVFKLIPASGYDEMVYEREMDY